LKIDSHQHFWRYDPAEYPWIKSDWPIRRDFLPNDLEPLLAAVGIEGCIAVQARQTLEESCWLVQVANEHPIVKGVVGWVDLRSEGVEEQLADLSRHPKFVGVRHVVQDEPDDRFMTRPEFMRGIGKLKQFRLKYDILIFPKQLPAAIELAGRFSDQPFVLDHIAKPLIRDGALQSWREQIFELAKFPNVSCKVSGMITEAKWQEWNTKDFTPYLDVVFEAFGPDRVMYGSDWPVCLLAGSYERAFGIVDDYTRQFSIEDREKFFGGNAARFYGLFALG
jgi:L-fuconolactonase